MQRMIFGLKSITENISTNNKAKINSNSWLPLNFIHPSSPPESRAFASDEKILACVKQQTLHLFLDIKYANITEICPHKYITYMFKSRSKRIVNVNPESS